MDVYERVWADGRGFARVSALVGHDTLVLNLDEDRVERGEATIRSRLERDVARDRITPDTLVVAALVCMQGRSAS